MRLLSRIYPVVWALLLSIFVVRTAPILWKNLCQEKIARVNPDASMDRFLETLLRVSQPSARLNRTFAQLPAGAPILFVSSKNDDRWDFVYSAVCYLAWPRKIDRVELTSGEKFTGGVPAQTAVVFCGMPPPIAAEHRESIGPNLTVLTSQ